MNKFIFYIIVLATFCSVLPLQTVSAQSSGLQREYTLLAPIPGTTKAGSAKKTDFGTYISGMYTFTLGIAGVLAVIMIIFAGFTYMTTDAFQKKQEGKERIKNAILGLLLALGTWVILYTIGGSRLTEINLNIERPVISSGGTPLGVGASTPGGLPESEWSQGEREARAMLPSGVRVSGDGAGRGPCPPGQTRDCVTLEGLPTSVFSALGGLKSNCPTCTVSISGGTEDGHREHGLAAPVVDLSYNTNLANYIRENGTLAGQATAGPIYRINNMTVTIEYEGTPCRPGGGPCQHFHVRVGE